MRRIPEPELMDEREQALAYDAADFEVPHASFIALLSGRMPDWPARGRAIDLGCGPGDITLRFARRFPQWTVVGVDGAEAMLELARLNARRAELHPRVSWERLNLPADAFPGAPFDAAISNSLLHHLHEPAVLWSSLRRVLPPGAPVFVMDLMRPDSRQAAAALVDSHADGEPELLRRDFYNSLLAAFTPEEVEAQLRDAGLAALDLEVVSDRHLIVYGRMP